MAKSAYASFRATNISFLFDYLRSIEGYRDDAQKYTKSTERKHLRKALIAFFSQQGDTYNAAELAADLNLTKGYTDQTHMDELISLLNTKGNTIADIDPLLELQIYLVKKAMLQQNPDPSFEIISKRIEGEAKV